MTIQSKICTQDNVNPSRGFTMLEIIAVLVILGVLSAVAVSRFTDIGARDVAEANTLKVHLRYAQLRAMGDIVPWGIEIEADQYTLVRQDGSVSNLPGESSSTKDDIEVHIEPVTVWFSAARGQPMNGPDQDPRNDALGISVGNQTITITAETGFIE